MADNTKDLDEILGELIRQVQLISIEPSGKGKPTGITGHHENSTFKSDYDAIRLKITDKSMENDENTEHLAEKIAEEKVARSLEKELTDQLQSEADKINCGDINTKVKIKIHRVNSVDSDLIERYNQVSPPLLMLSKRLQQQVIQILKDKRDGGKLTGLYMGKRLNSRQLFKNDGRIFYNNRLPEDTPDIAVAVLCDESGSMSVMNRIESARNAGIIIHDFCVKLGIHVIVYGHSTDFTNDDVDLFAYAEFDSHDKKDMYRMMSMRSRNYNHDGAALRFVAERLMKRQEKTKLLILISDGQPSAMGYSGSEAEADLRKIKREYTNKGITMFAAAIGDDKENIKRIYKDGFLDITDLNKLPVNLTSLIKSYIK